MKPLGDFYKKNGFYYKLLKREGDIAIFQQRLDENKGCLAFEVIIVQKGEEYEMAGMKIEAHEYAPGNEQFGMKGWSFSTLEKAEIKFKELLNKVNEPSKRKKRKKA